MEMGPLQSGDGAPAAPAPTDNRSTRQRVADAADRERAGEIADDDKRQAGTALHADRIDEIRRKIEAGYYDRPDVKKLIADRLSGRLGEK